MGEGYARQRPITHFAIRQHVYSATLSASSCRASPCTTPDPGSQPCDGRPWAKLQAGKALQVRILWGEPTFGFLALLGRVLRAQRRRDHLAPIAGLRLGAPHDEDA